MDDYVYTGEDEILMGDVERGERFTEAQINRKIIIEAREKSRVNEYLKMLTKDKKQSSLTSQDHAALIRDLINELTTSNDPNYCQRVTSKSQLVSSILGSSRTMRGTALPFSQHHENSQQELMREM